MSLVLLPIKTSAYTCSQSFKDFFCKYLSMYYESGTVLVVVWDVNMYKMHPALRGLAV